MSKIKLQIPEVQEQQLKFVWKHDSLYNLIMSSAPTTVSFKAKRYAQIVFKIDAQGNIKNQTNITLSTLVQKMKNLLYKTNSAELIFRKNIDAYGVIDPLNRNNKVIRLGKKKVNKITAYFIGILREDYMILEDEITLTCDIEEVTHTRLEQIKALLSK